MNQYIGNVNPKVNASSQLILMAVATIWLVILMFSNYKRWNMESQGDELECKLRYDGNVRCKFNGKSVIKYKIDSGDCSYQYICNTILATYPISIINIVLIITSIIMSLLKQSNLPGNTGTFNFIILVSILGAGISLFILSIILMTSGDLNAWVLVSQLFISIILFITVFFIRREEILSNNIRKQELLTETSLKPYVLQ